MLKQLLIKIVRRIKTYSLILLGRKKSLPNRQDLSDWIISVPDIKDQAEPDCGIFGSNSPLNPNKTSCHEVTDLERPLKVVFFTHNLNHEGAPSMLLKVAKGLSELGNIEAVIVAPCEGPWIKTMDEWGLRHEILSSRKNIYIEAPWTKKSLENAKQLVSDLLELESPDIVISNVILSHFFVVVASQKNIPTIWWIHESYDQSLLNKAIQKEVMPLCEQAFIDAKYVVFPSLGTCSLYSRFNSNKNFTVIHNGIDYAYSNIDKLYEDKKIERERLGIAQDKKVIVSIGTVSERKDQLTLVESIHELAQHREDFTCFIVGYRHSLEYGSKVARRIAQLGLEKYIQLIPETREVKQYYLAGDIFVNTSLNESYSLVILEAMSFGLPIVTTPCNGIAEQVEIGLNASVFDFMGHSQLKGKLEYFLDDEDTRKQYGEYSFRKISDMQGEPKMFENFEKLCYSAHDT